MKTLFTILTVFASIYYAHTATCTSLATGNWSDPLIWSCGAVPSPGDTIIIDATHIVTLSSNTDLTGAPVVIIINGTLLFDSPSAKLRLECGSSIIINPGGSIQDSGNGTASHSIKICGIDVWTGAMGPVHGPIVIVGIPLPVELIALSAADENRMTIVRWKTASENNNDHFNVWASVDGNSWEMIGSIAGAGNSTTTLDYTFEYYNADEQDYFKLEQVDFDGTSTFSPVIRRTVSSNSKLMVYPNPSSGEKVVIELPSDENYQLSITGMDGNILYNETTYSTSRVLLNNLNLPAGIYIISASSQTENFTTKLQIN